MKVGSLYSVNVPLDMEGSTFDRTKPYLLYLGSYVDNEGRAPDYVSDAPYDRFKGAYNTFLSTTETGISGIIELCEDVSDRLILISEIG